MFVFGVILFGWVPHAFALTGTISSSHKYAFSNVAGYINFAPTVSTVSVSDTALTGYAWSANDGWINLSPSQGGVKNDGTGKLSGFAWDSVAGWVNFSGVTIDSSGKFHGMATGGTVNGASYAINFDCTSCDVETNWTRAAAAAVNNGAISPVYVAPAAPLSSSIEESAVLPTTSLIKPNVTHASGTTARAQGKLVSILKNPIAIATTSHSTATSSASKTASALKTATSSFSHLIRSIGRNVINGLVTFLHLFWKF